MTPVEIQELRAVASRLQVSPVDLYKLIKFESGFDPVAKNPRSSARGILQFLDSTARDFGYSDSLDLVNKNPTVSSQLSIVESYLRQYAPFATKDELYMSVFYPAYRKMSTDTEFPESVRTANPGINKISDYVDLIDRQTVPADVATQLAGSPAPANTPNENQVFYFLLAGIALLTTVYLITKH